MKKDIETKFLSAWKFGGVVDDCIDVIRQRYDLGFSPNNKPLSKMWQKVYDETIPARIQAATEAFDDTVIIYLDSPLIEEISDNLDECKTMQEKERYIYTLIVPFNELSELLYPGFSSKQRIEKEISEHENDKKYWESITDDDFNNFIINGKKLKPNEAKKYVKSVLEAIENVKRERNEQYKRLEMISDRFRQILKEPKDEVEKSLSAFCGLSFKFADRLDALCLQNGIDLMRLQKDCGTYLKAYRSIQSLCGSFDL